MKPRIGVPRVYGGDELPLIYPGETAIARSAPITLDGATRGPMRVTVTGWLVEPAPGWRARWLRLRYRVWGQWWGGGSPTLEVSASTMDPEEES